MKTQFSSLVIIVLLSLIGLNSHAELYLVNEKCQIKGDKFSMSTSLKSLVEDGISEHSYSSVLRLNGQKAIALKPQSEIDQTPMSIGSSYTLVNESKKKKIHMLVRKGVEKSSFSSTKDVACGPVLSIKEYDVKIQGITKAPMTATMLCDQRSVFVSKKCEGSKSLAKRN